MKTLRLVGAILFALFALSSLRNIAVGIAQLAKGTGNSSYWLGYTVGGFVFATVLALLSVYCWKKYKAADAPSDQPPSSS